MKKPLLAILGAIMTIAGAQNIQSARVMSEDWNRGSIDQSVWGLAGLDRGEIELEEVGAGDYALVLSTGNEKCEDYETRVYSKSMIPRGENVRCTFRVWHDGTDDEVGFSGPWHHSPEPLKITYPSAYTIEAGLIAADEEDRNQMLNWFEAGDCTEDEKGMNLHGAFNEAFRAADSKADSLMIQVELGDHTGARGFYSTDNGDSWLPIELMDETVIDSRGKAAVSRLYGDTGSGSYLTVSSMRFNFVGFAPCRGKIFVDDIMVDSDAAAVLPLPKPTPRMDPKELITREMVEPRGKYYEASVPDTLDLAYHAELLVQGIINFTNPEQGYCTYGQGYFNVNPPYMTQINGSEGHCCWSKNNEALIKARAMSGSDYKVDVHTEMLRNLLDKKNVINPTAHLPWMPRSMLALATLYQISPIPELKELLDGWVDYQDMRLVREYDYAYFDDSPPHIEEGMLGVLGYWRVAFIHGTLIRQMSTWHRVSGNETAIKMSGEMKNFLTQEQYWQPEAGPKVVVSADRAHFMGHHHSFTTALMGLLWYAEATDDQRLMEFCRSGYEYMRNFGLARIGLFAEMCTTGDMLQLALKLSDLGVGDYWEDADSYIRNHLFASQVTDTELLQQVVDTMPENERELHPVFETADNVVERNRGCYLSDASNPTLIREKTMVWTICCNGNVTPAVYYAWEACVRDQGDDRVQVNFLLNRASPWVDVDSYLPYEGKVVLHNKTAREIAVRIPRWVDEEKVRTMVGGRSAETHWLDRNLVIEDLDKRDEITITFPMVTTTEAYTLKWRERDFWYESTNPGWAWEADDPALKYTMTFKGNTLVDIEPRSQSNGYPLYLRDHLRDNDVAPMKKVTRFVPEVWPEVY